MAVLEADGGVRVRHRPQPPGARLDPRLVLPARTPLRFLGWRATRPCAAPPQDPAASRLLEGRWRLLFTTRPGTASPIQRTFTGVEGFSVFQDIELSGDGEARVNNVVDFGKGIGYLKVCVSHRTPQRRLLRPLPSP